MSEPVVPQSLAERYSVFSVQGEGRWLTLEERSRLRVVLAEAQTFGSTRVLRFLSSAEFSHALVLHRNESRTILLFNRRPEDSRLILDLLLGQEHQEILLSEGRKPEFLDILFQ